MHRKLAVFLRLVMFSHTLFSLPYAVSALLILRPGPWQAVLVLLALVSARTLANAINRVVDRKYDGWNPRTAARPLCTGEAALWDTFVFCLVCGGIFLLSVLLLRPQLVLLLPVAGFFFAFYAFTKRFTAACHFVLGTVCSLSVVGVCLALDAPVLWGLVGACAFAVAGFDILYAIEDIEFDRTFFLHSLPALCGPRRSVLVASGSFFASAACMGRILPVAGLCLYAVFCVAATLAFSGAYKTAGYRMNQTAGGILLLLFGIHYIVT